MAGQADRESGRKIGTEMEKAADSSSTPNPGRGNAVIGGLNEHSSMMHDAAWEARVNYFDAPCECGVAGIAEEFSPFVIRRRRPAKGWR